MGEIEPCAPRALAALLAIFVAGPFSYAHEGAGQEQLREQIAALMKSSGEEYVRLRSALLALPLASSRIAELKAGVKDPIMAILCEALLFRLSKPDAARLLDHWWGREYARRGVTPHGSSPARLHVTNPTRFYPYLIMFCFGAEALPVVSENLLFAWREPAARLDVVSTLLHMREPRAIPVLAKVALHPDEPVQVRGSCLNAFESIFVFVDQRERVAKPQLWLERWAPYSFPQDFKDWPKKQWTMGPWPLTAEHKAEIFATFRKVLSEKSADPDHSLLRAIAAAGLAHAGRDAVEALGAGLRADDSPWVRAWCAMGLLGIGGEQALAILQERAKTEQDPAVLQVINGVATPRLPLCAPYPGQSIVFPRRPSN